MKTKAIEYKLKATKQDFTREKINNSEDAQRFARKFYSYDINIFESSFIILINSANTAIGYAKISQGGVCSTIVDIRIIAKYAIESLCTAVIFVHNHPSGNTKPSQQDINFTSRIKSALQIFDIKLLDSIIITDDSFYSLNDNGDM